MSLATIAAPPDIDLGGLADAAARRSGAWVVVESAGLVLAHGTGVDACPPTVAAALLQKSAALLRKGVVWRRGTGRLHGTVDGTEVAAADLRDGVTAWFVGGEVDEATLPLLAAAVHGETAVTDPVVAELLHPRGPRRDRAPAALLVAVRADIPLVSLSTRLRRLVVGTGVRVHTEADHVLVVLPSDEDPRPFLTLLRDDLPGAVAGLGPVRPQSADWVAAAGLAAACADVAAELDLPYGDARSPLVAAELLVREARQSVAELVVQLPVDPLAALREYDERCGADLVATVTAWCRAGFDIATTATDMHLHTNSVRYRLRRAEAIGGLDLSRPRQLLALQILLDA